MRFALGVIRLVRAELRYRWGRTLALTVALTVATASFTLLTKASESSRLETRGLVASQFRVGYDLLVRPRGREEPLERQAQLIQRNFQSGIFGGITLAQLRQIREIQGVEVAAPLAMLGYIQPTIEVPVRLGTRLAPGPRSAFGISTLWRSDRGMSTAQDDPSYVYVTHAPLEFFRGPLTDTSPLALEHGKGVCPTGRYNSLSGLQSPFAPGARSRMLCWSTKTGLNGQAALGSGPRTAPQNLGATVLFAFPLLVAGIDPQAEARLSGLSSTVTGGRYLRGSDRPFVGQTGSARNRKVIPLLMSQRSFLDLEADVTVRRLPVSVAERVRSQRTPRQLRRLLQTSAGEVVARHHVSAERAYKILLSYARGTVPFDSYWTAGPVRLQRIGDRAVRAVGGTLSAATWSSNHGFDDLPFVNVPVTAGDVAFRPVTEHLGFNSGRHPIPAIRAVGTFEPGRLPGLRDATATVLSPYAPAQGRRADGADLIGNGNLAGYLTSPPLALTTLAAAGSFGSSLLFDRAERAATAPISSVRVRVDDIRGADAASRERLRLVAQQIEQRTHLRVDVTAGSSPTDVQVSLPKGRLGRPALTVVEQWTKKGVATTVLDAVDRKSVALFVTVLLVCGLFCFNATAAAVRMRRSELGVLSCMGWPARRLVALIVLEVGAVGMSAGTLGGTLAWVAGQALSPPVGIGRAAVAIPVAMALALVAGVIPALRAAQQTAVAAVRPAVADVRTAGHGATILQLALTNLRRVPARAVLGAAGLAVGVCALCLLLAVSLGFQGAVVGTVLGDASAVQARASDYAAAVAALALGAVAITDIAYLNLRDRSSEFATLQAVGWAQEHARRLAVYEGMIIGFGGAAAGAALGVVGTLMLFGDVPAVVFGIAAAAGLLGTGIGALAAFVPATIVLRQPLARQVSEEP